MESLCLLLCLTSLMQPGQSRPRTEGTPAGNGRAPVMNTFGFRYGVITGCPQCSQFDGYPHLTHVFLPQCLYWHFTFTFSPTLGMFPPLEFADPLASVEIMVSSLANMSISPAADRSHSDHISR
jgi:hypothetical protein